KYNNVEKQPNRTKTPTMVGWNILHSKAPLRHFRFLRKPSSNGFRKDDYPATRSPKECLGKSTFRTRRSLSGERKYDAQPFRRRRHHEVVGSPIKACHLSTGI